MLFSARSGSFQLLKQRLLIRRVDRNDIPVYEETFICHLLAAQAIQPVTLPGNESGQEMGFA